MLGPHRLRLSLPCLTCSTTTLPHPDHLVDKSSYLTILIYGNNYVCQLQNVDRINYFHFEDSKTRFLYKETMIHPSLHPTTL